MNYYDKEINVIDGIKRLSIFEILFLSVSFREIKFFRSIFNERKFANWVDSSGKNQIPPDFYSDKYKYMLEVMRFDDYERLNNCPNALESKIYKEINNQRRLNGVPTFEEMNLKVMIVPDYSKASDNGYDTYFDNFKNSFLKHECKIDDYKRNHPGYTLGFLLVDESAGYVESEKVEHKTYKPGDMCMNVRLHFPFLDDRFMNVVKMSNVDYLIWYMPYKNNGKNIVRYPICVVIDIKKFKRKPYKLITYESSRMICLEV